MRTASIVAAMLVAACCLPAPRAAQAETIGWTLMPDWAPPIGGAYPGAGDLDGDGDTDLLVSLPYEGLRNDGGCAVTPWVSMTSWGDGLPSTASCAYPRLEVADLDKDGDCDVLIGCYYGSVRFYENEGSPSVPVWTRNDAYFYTNWSGFRAPAAVDLDADGDLDIVAGVSAGTSHLIVYWNEGTPQEPSWLEDRDFFSSIAPAGISVDPNFADIDQDGDLDLVALPVEMENVPPNVYENIGTAVSPVWSSNPGLLHGIESVYAHHGGVLTDLDCDNRPDLVMFVITADLESEVRCYRNDGPVTAVEQTSWGLLKALYR